MKKNIKVLLAGFIMVLPTLGIVTSSVVNADTVPASEIQPSSQIKNEIPYVTNIETGNFLYLITKPIGVQNLNGISPLMLINPDNIFHYSDVKVTMSDGTVLLRFKDGLYINKSEVESNILR